jgi:hypothetical protein
MMRRKADFYEGQGPEWLLGESKCRGMPEIDLPVPADR